MSFLSRLLVLDHHLDHLGDLGGLVEDPDERPLRGGDVHEDFAGPQNQGGRSYHVIGFDIFHLTIPFLLRNLLGCGRYIAFTCIFVQSHIITLITLNYIYGNKMAEIRPIETDFVHLARLALSGRPQDVQVFLHRAAKKYRDAVPELAERSTIC